MSAPPVSVIVPAFNAEKTIARCLSSLERQTLSGIEVVVVDDGSTDATARLVQGHVLARRGSIRLVTQPNSGRAAARNTGLHHATGEFVGFVDADDEALPEMYELLLDCAQRTGADLVVGEYEGVDARTGEHRFHYPEGDATLYGTSVAETPELLLQPGASVCNKLIRRSLFTGSGITFPEGRDFEDLATAYRLTGDAARVEKVSHVVYRYRQGLPSSVMTACDRRYLEIVPALEITLDHFRREGRFDSLRPQLQAVCFIHLLSGRLDDLLRYGCIQDRRALIHAAFTFMDERFPGWRVDEALRASSGRRLKHVVLTHHGLLALYAAYQHARYR